MIGLKIYLPIWNCIEKRSIFNPNCLHQGLRICLRLTLLEKMEAVISIRIVFSCHFASTKQKSILEFVRKHTDHFYSM